jgi:hypothetical protein
MVGGPRRGSAAVGLAAHSSTRQQAGKLGGGQMSPAPGTQGSQVNVHDSHALQSLRPVSQRGAHAADLAIQPLSENHAKRHLIDAADLARLGQLTHDFHAACHHLQRKIGDWAIHRHDVLFFMIVFGTEDLVDDIAVVREEDQTLRVLVQSPYGKDALRVPDEIDDVVLDVGFRGAGNSDGLIEGNIDLLFFDADRLTVDAYVVAVHDPRAQRGELTVASNAARIDPLVRLTPRTDAGFADVLIESHLVLRLGGAA